MSMTLLENRDVRDCGPELVRRRREPKRQQRARRAGAAAASQAGGAAPGQPSHTPVLADELIGLLDPQPGQLAIDCTFGDGGHARLVAERLGSSGTLVAIDRDPLAEQRFADWRRRRRARCVSSAPAMRRRSSYPRARAVQADMVYFDLGMSSMQWTEGAWLLLLLRGPA